METVEVFIYILVAVILLTVAAFSYFYTEKVRADADKKLQYVVDQINNSQYYSFNYDKEQQTNLKTVDQGISIVDKKLDVLGNEFKTLNSQALTKNDISNKITTANLQADKVSVGKTYDLTSKSTTPNDNTQGLFIYGPDGVLGDVRANTLYSQNGVVEKDLSVGGNTHLKTTDIDKLLRVNIDKKNIYPSAFSENGGVHATNVFADNGAIAAGSGGLVNAFMKSDGTLYAGNEATFTSGVNFQTSGQNDFSFQMKRVRNNVTDNLKVFMNSKLNNNNQNLEVYMGPCSTPTVVECSQFKTPRFVVKSTGDAIVNGTFKVCNTNGENCRTI